MRVEWKGHASFLFTASNGKRILTDPFNEKVGLPLPHVKVDIVTVSHQHGDHNSTGLLPGTPLIVQESGQYDVDGVDIVGIKTFHDDQGGAKKGNNTVFVITIDDVSVCHLGDIGHILTQEQVSAIGKVDVLCVPVGGFYTVDAKEAWAIVQQLQPSVILPMHYKVDARVTAPIGPVENFTGLFSGIVEKRATLDWEDAYRGEQRLVVLELA